MERESETLAAQETAARVQRETLKGQDEDGHREQLLPLAQGWGTTTSIWPDGHTARSAGTPPDHVSEAGLPGPEGKRLLKTCTIKA